MKSHAAGHPNAASEDAHPGDPPGLAARARRELHFAAGSLPARADRVEAYRTFLTSERERILADHRAGASGLSVSREGALLIDALLTALYDAAGKVLAPDYGSRWQRIAVLALGGYGRGEVCPFSDVDILLLHPPDSPRDSARGLPAAFAEEMLYPLWDLGLKVGHATRTVSEALSEADREPKSRNALLEMRFLFGNESLAEQLNRRFRSRFRRRRSALTLQSQIENAVDRRTQQGDSLYLQEPDIKNGVGGLRDYQNVLWMSHIRFDRGDPEVLVENGILSPARLRQFHEAYDFLLRVRNELHFFAGRATDLLSLDRQPTIAAHLGYPEVDLVERVEAFMRDYYARAQCILRTASRVESRILRRDLPFAGDRFHLRDVLASRRPQRKRRIDGFLLEKGLLHRDEPGAFQADPLRLVRVFRHAQQLGADLHDELAEEIEESLGLLEVTDPWQPALQKIMRALLNDAGRVFPAVASLHEVGVLGHILPEFGRLTCLVQHEYYHRYTADMHTLETLHQLDRVFARTEPPWNSYLEALRRTEYPTLLYLALLLHDIGKADGVRGHAQRGAVLAAPILSRIGLPEPLHGEILFLIENHLEMARFSQRFDLDDPTTIQSFARFAGTPTRLAYLYAHTYCDALGTAENLWNGYKQLLHESLYRKTLSLLEKGADRSLMEREYREHLEEQLLGEGAAARVEREEVEAHLNGLPDRYFVQNSLDEVVLHLDMVHQLLVRIQTADSVGALAPIIDWQDSPDQGLSTVTVVTWDRGGLFFNLAGALSVSGLNILSTKAVTRADHIAIDTFTVVGPDGGPVSDPAARSKFESHVHEALVENRDLLEAIEREARKYESGYLRRNGATLASHIDPVINVYHELTLQRTIIEVQAPDTLGLLYKLGRVITEHGFDITFARIDTENGIANDTFYIEGVEPTAHSPGNHNLLLLRQALADTVRSEQRKAG